MLHQLKHLKRNVALNDDMFLELVQIVEDCFEEYPQTRFQVKIWRENLFLKFWNLMSFPRKKGNM